MLPEQIAYITVFIGLIGASFYARSIWKGTTRPNFVSWFFWMVAPFIGAYLQIKAGAGLSVLAVFTAGLIPFVVLLAAAFKKNGYWQIGRFDILCGVFSALAITLWIVTQNTAVSILFAILADFAAAIPTYKKSWEFPESENFVGYVPSIINNTLALLVIKDWSFSVASFSIYLILINTSIITILFRRKIFKLS